MTVSQMCADLEDSLMDFDLVSAGVSNWPGIVVTFVKQYFSFGEW